MCGQTGYAYANSFSCVYVYRVHGKLCADIFSRFRTVHDSEGQICRSKYRVTHLCVDDFAH